MSSFTENLAAVKKAIERHALHAGLAVPTPNIIAVSKRQSDEKIQQALDAGFRVFGENLVQEAEGRWAARRAAYPDLHLHLIGHLQTNKAKEAVALFDVIHTLDRPKLADKLASAMQAAGKSLPLYIQVNTGEEEQKSGVLPKDLPALLAHAQTLGLNVVGLMCIPPVDDLAALHFGLLKKLAGEHGLTRLSMGMSSDYDLAASMGATDVRVGSALFGARQT